MDKGRAQQWCVVLGSSPSSFSCSCSGGFFVSAQGFWSSAAFARSRGIMADKMEAAGAAAAEGLAPERRIAVAVDESEESMYALGWCLRNVLAEKDRNTIILLYVRPPPPVYSSLDGTGYLFSDDVITTIEKYSKDLADSVMQRAKKIYKDYNTVKVEAKVASGDARDVICELVGKVGADLLVMGSHGYGFIKRALLGSVSDYCARKAKCPVLIVKRPAN